MIRGIRAGAALAASLAGLAVLTTGGLAAAAPPEVVFNEDFEHGQSAPGAAVFLDDYTGAPPFAQTYTAHPGWISGAACNGLIGARGASTAGTGCPQSVWNTYIGPAAAAIGATFGGGDANHVLGDTTTRSSPANEATLETVDPVPLPEAGRFVTFSIDVGVTACSAPADPLLRFFLLDGQNAIPTSAAPINPCTDPRSSTTVPGGAGGIRVGRYAADTAVLVNSPAVGMRVTNAQGGSNGNDYSVDNVSILDATPSLAKSFAPAHILPGEASTLTFTVTNTDELASKAGWSFTDQLPEGMTVAGAGSTTCHNGAVTAASGGTSVSASGDLRSAEASCTVDVPVTASRFGEHVNGPEDVTTVGLDEPTAATLTVDVPPVAGVCRGTPVAAFGLDSPATANPSESPCVTSKRSMVRINTVLGGNSPIGALLEPVANTMNGDLIEGSTEMGATSARGEAHAADLTIRASGLVVRLQGVTSEARSGLTSSCADAAVQGASSIAALTINGVKRMDLVDAQGIPLPGLGGVYLNHQMREGNTITQRAVFVDLPGTALDVVVGEAKAGVACA